MGLYTRTGDDGTTGLVGERRTSKADPRMEVIGTIDELNSLLGLAVSLYPPPPSKVIQRVNTIQPQLFRIGAELADPEGESGIRLAPATVKALEQAIDSFDNPLPPLTGFIVPGGCSAGATLHLARTVCRRAERAMTAFNSDQPQENQLRPTLLTYLNRLSDLLYAMARYTNHRLDVAERKVKMR